MRVRWLLPLLVLALCAVGVQAQDARPADRRGADDQMDMPAAPLRVHEWGVWHVGRNGQMDSLAQLARESPAFVHRAPAVPSATEPDLGPFQDPSQYGTFDKPVVFLYATTELDVTVRVRVPHGRPWLYFPDATSGRISGDRALSWTGHALLQGATPPANVALPAAPAGHWWNHLRAVGASPFVPTGATSYEKFLFYDGEAPFPVGFRATGNGEPTPIAGHVDPIAWLVGPQGEARLDVNGAVATRTDIPRHEELVRGLRAQLVARGLSAAETESLLRTWNVELFGHADRHIVWLITRAEYDAMLPLEVLPTPIETVRVGVVIQSY